MCGNDDIVEEDLYQGTAKSMEGVLLDECYEHQRLKVTLSKWCGRMGIPFQLEKSQLYSWGIQSIKSIIDDNRYQSIPIDIN